MSTQVLIPRGPTFGLATTRYPPAFSSHCTGSVNTDLHNSQWRQTAGCGSKGLGCQCYLPCPWQTADLPRPKRQGQRSLRFTRVLGHQRGFSSTRRGKASGRGVVQAALVSSAGGGTQSESVLTEVAQSNGAAIKDENSERRTMEKLVGKLIVNCRFFTLAGVFGSLMGSLLCFLKGTYYVYAAIIGYFMMLFNMPNRCKVVLKLIEALDTYLVGTVMLIFGMGLYELFVMKLDGTVDAKESGSTLFGLFPLEKRPPWLAIQGLDDLKTKLGHVIVMILLVGMFEKSKIVHPTCSLDLFLTAGAVLLCAGSLFLLSRLKPDTKSGGETSHLH